MLILCFHPTCIFQVIITNYKKQFSDRDLISEEKEAFEILNALHQGSQTPVIDGRRPVNPPYVPAAAHLNNINRSLKRPYTQPHAEVAIQPFA